MYPEAYLKKKKKRYPYNSALIEPTLQNGTWAN